ncbi:MAG: hypothetical protein D6689_12495 [Deltaproteobacteria bacterium]|nr:MAG: hypothetical protein D6689_12495 [Deltaproteobacteria bacterium]
MTRFVRACGVATIVAVAACGGPPVGAKVPKADPKKVAVGAAATATVLTLMNPELAGKRPEEADPERPHKVRSSGEAVPPDVLDRLDRDAGPRQVPCAPAPADAARRSDAGAGRPSIAPYVPNPNRPRCPEPDALPDGDGAGSPPATAAPRER